MGFLQLAAWAVGLQGVVCEQDTVGICHKHTTTGMIHLGTNTFTDRDPSVETDIPTDSEGRFTHPHRSPPI